MRQLFFLIFIPILTLHSCSKKEVIVNKSSAKNIKTFTFNLSNSTIKTSIDSIQRIISITLPVGSDASKLTPTITISDKANISPKSGTEQNFTKPIIYTLIAEDGSKITYTVIVTVTKSSEKSIKSFLFSNFSPAISGKIDTTNKIVIATVPIGFDLSKLIPDIVISERATISPASGKIQDFSNTVNYIITAEDGTSQNYMIVVKEQIDNCDKNNTIKVKLNNKDFIGSMCQGGLWQSKSNNYLFLSLCLDGYYADTRFIDVIGNGVYLNENFSLRDFSKSKDIFKVDEYFNGTLKINIIKITESNITATFEGTLKSSNGNIKIISGAICDYKYN